MAKPTFEILKKNLICKREQEKKQNILRTLNWQKKRSRIQINKKILIVFQGKNMNYAVNIKRSTELIGFYVNGNVENKREIISREQRENVQH